MTTEQLKTCREVCFGLQRLYTDLDQGNFKFSGNGVTATRLRQNLKAMYKLCKEIAHIFEDEYPEYVRDL